MVCRYPNKPESLYNVWATPRYSEFHFLVVKVLSVIENQKLSLEARTEDRRCKRSGLQHLGAHRRTLVPAVLWIPRAGWD
ncbi:hypothetical protein NDU88_004971 [Pleurodeles waltl]|uniref:Uncharacterized protein n=1 Tax=Pleurodeles waltl TaxID=8319 RepID=A0AAV7QJV9_PLEWA|nr:hypothetical protein NDU88_004971 [Pleurodeles waltl]